MKRNPDSIRAVLLYIEENQKIGETLSSGSIIKDILKDKGMCSGYEDDLLYAIKQLCADGMLYGGPICPKNQAYINAYYVKDITPRGHDFIENIRDKTIWNETKIKAKSVGSFALDILNQIAVSVVSSKLTGL